MSSYTNNQKKNYLKPEMVVIEMAQEGCLLSDSSCDSCEDGVHSIFDDTEEG